MVLNENAEKPCKSSALPDDCFAMKSFYKFLTIFWSAQLLLATLLLGDEEAKTLLVIGELKGKITTFVENNGLLDEPKFEDDKVSDSQFIQIQKRNNKEHLVLVHNTGSNELFPVPVKDGIGFLSVGDNMHSQMTICFNRKFPDGSYLVIVTQTRVDFLNLGVTSVGVMHGHAKPSPALHLWLQEQGFEK